MYIYCYALAVMIELVEWKKKWENQLSREIRESASVVHLFV